MKKTLVAFTAAAALLTTPALADGTTVAATNPAELEQCVRGAMGNLMALDAIMYPNSMRDFNVQEFINRTDITSVGTVRDRYIFDVELTLRSRHNDRIGVAVYSFSNIGRDERAEYMMSGWGETQDAIDYNTTAFADFDPFERVRFEVMRACVERGYPQLD